jgi:hypothetical protein
LDQALISLLGPNGQGKTTILEGACVLLRLQSQRSATLAPVIKMGRKHVVMHFRPGAADDLGAQLEQSRAEENRLRQTLIGPHRDDLELRIDAMTAAQFGSEGQQRSAALALKIAQADIFQREGSAPLFGWMIFSMSWPRTGATRCSIIYLTIYKISSGYLHALAGGNIDRYLLPVVRPAASAPCLNHGV